MDSRGKAYRRPSGEPPVSERYDRPVPVPSELPADNGIFAGRQPSARLDLPFVLEEMGRVPRQYAAGHVVLGRAAPKVDRPPLPADESGARHIPTLELLRVGDGRPHLFGRMPNPAREGDSRVLSVENDSPGGRGLILGVSHALTACRLSMRASHRGDSQASPVALTRTDGKTISIGRVRAAFLAEASRFAAALAAVPPRAAPREVCADASRRPVVSAVGTHLRALRQNARPGPE